MPPSELKKSFNKYKTRVEGGEVAGFTLHSTGDMEIIEPTRMKVMNPQKMKTALSGKGIGGSFAKVSGGMRFTIMAGKQGGAEGQPWVKLHLKKNLGISNLEVTTSSDADVDPDPKDLIKKKSGKESPNESLDLLGMLEDDSEEVDTTGTEDLLGMLDEPDSEEIDIPVAPDLPLDLLGVLDEEEDTGELVDPDLKKAWIPVARSMADAVIDVDNGLSKLRSALLSSGDEELEEIADAFFGSGFPEIHGGHKVKFMSALLDVERQSEVDAYTSALNLIVERSTAYLEHLKSSQRVVVCDDNPAHKVGIVKTIGAAVADMQKEANRQVGLL